MRRRRAGTSAASARCADASSSGASVSAGAAATGPAASTAAGAHAAPRPGARGPWPSAWSARASASSASAAARVSPKPDAAPSAAGLADAPAHGGARLGGRRARVAAHGRERPGAGADRRRGRGHVGRARRRQTPGLVPELADARPRRGPEDVVSVLAGLGREPRRDERRRRPALRLRRGRGGRRRRPVAVAAALRLDASNNTCAGKRTVSTTHGGTRTRNLRLRRATPCPLGHASFEGRDTGPRRPATA